MREEDEVVVYLLVVVGTVESVDGLFSDGLRKIHYIHTRNSVICSRNIPISIISTYPHRIEFMKLARAL